ncbi:MAG: DNA internalization-related competence protein ComEC/Rec2 [Eubacteriales bacterium]|nr:DNA internalization-related competence protein ComEC/Rec2 [Eubacteriales bacterium]
MADLSLEGEFKVLRTISQNRTRNTAGYLLEFVASEKGADEAKYSGLRIILYASRELNYVKAFRARLELEKMTEALNPGAFSQAAYGRGFAATFSARLKKGQYEVLEFRRLLRLRESLTHGLEQLRTLWQEDLAPDSVALLNALFLGDKSALQAYDQECLRTSSLSHLASVSGLHLYFILQPLQMLFRACPRLKRFDLALSLCLLLPWYFLLGFRPSFLRALLLFLFNHFGRYSAARSGGLNNLAWVAFCLIFYEPFLIFNLGFQFSFLASAAILILAPKLSQLLLKLCPILGETITELLAVGLAVQLLMFLPQYLISWQVNLFALALNILAAFVVNLIFQLSFLQLALYGLQSLVRTFIFKTFNFSFLNKVLARLVDSTTAAFLTLARKGQALAGQLSGRRQIFLLLTFVICLIAAFFLWRKKAPWPHPKWRLQILQLVLILSSITLTLHFALYQMQPDLELLYLSVGQGNSTLIRYGKTAILIDGGVPEQAYSSVLPALHYFGVKKIDLAVISHGHNDHIGGILELLKLGKVSYLSYPESEVDEPNSPYNQAFWREFKARYPGRSLSAGDQITISSKRGFSLSSASKREDRLEIKVLAPSSQRTWLESNKNDASVVLELSYQDLSFLFTADATAPVEAEIIPLIQGAKLKVLQVAHHGSTTSSTSEFLAAYPPDLAIISVGRNNYGHPKPEILERLASSGRILRTDQDGAILIQYKGGNWTVSTQRRKAKAILVKEGEKLAE